MSSCVGHVTTAKSIPFTDEDSEMQLKASKWSLSWGYLVISGVLGDIGEVVVVVTEQIWFVLNSQFAPVVCCYRQQCWFSVYAAGFSVLMLWFILIVFFLFLSSSIKFLIDEIEKNKK